MYTSENNWYSWSYGDLEPFSRQPGNLKFQTAFSKYTEKVNSFKEELLNAAKSSLEHSTDKPVLLFSGGVDSELILRAFLDIGYTPKIIIVRYEKDYNIYDVSYAVTLCSILNVQYNILNFNLEKFYENDAERISDLAQIDRPRALPYCKFMEIVDGFPILGNGDLTPTRLHGDYSIRAEWLIRCGEFDIGWSKFLRAINKPGIAEWHKWTPGLVVSYMNLKWFNQLINDKIYGKQGSSSSKIIGYREAYPDLLTRKKQTGFERIDTIVARVENHLKIKNKGLIYRNYCDRTVTQLIHEITGN